MSITIDDIQVRKIELVKNQEYMFARAIIVICGVIVIKGLTINRGKFDNDPFRNFAVQPPSLKYYGKMYKVMFFEDEGLWKQICDLVIDAYLAHLKVIESKQLPSTGYSTESTIEDTI